MPYKCQNMKELCVGGGGAFGGEFNWPKDICKLAIFIKILWGKKKLFFTVSFYFLFFMKVISDIYILK